MCVSERMYIMYQQNPGIELSTPGLQDNNNIVIPGTSSGWITNFQIPFDPDALCGNYNGFRATIVNDDFGGEQAVGYIGASAPDGKYFFENGQQYSSLTIAPKEGAELLGFGEGDDFRGWIVLNRFYVGNKVASGLPVPIVLCSGYVDKNGNLLNQSTYKECKAKKDSLLENGCYRIIHNIGHFNYFIQLTPVNTDFYWAWYKINPVVLEKNANDVLIGMFDSIKECVGVNYGFEFCITGGN